MSLGAKMFMSTEIASLLLEKKANDCFLINLRDVYGFDEKELSLAYWTQSKFLEEINDYYFAEIELFQELYPEQIFSAWGRALLAEEEMLDDWSYLSIEELKETKLYHAMLMYSFCKELNIETLPQYCLRECEFSSESSLAKREEALEERKAWVLIYYDQDIFFETFVQAMEYVVNHAIDNLETD